MKINWKLRLQNKATLTALIFTIIGVVYKILSLLEIVPAIAQGTVEEIAELVIFILCFFGIVIDPTTAGTNDSERAMGYTEPYRTPVEDIDNDKDGGQ